jgi:uncharacterized protein YjdB
MYLSRPNFMAHMTLGGILQLRRARVAQWVAIAASTLAAVTCDLVTAPKAGTGSAIAVQYTGDTVLTVGTVIPFKAMITEGGVPIEGARLHLTTSDSNVVAVRDVDLGTDSIIVKARGTARIHATLVGSTLGDVPPSTEVEVHALASALAFDDSASVTLRNIGDTLRLRVTVYGASPLGATPIDSNPAVQSFTSSNPNIVTVDSRGRLLAHANGVDTITAAVDTSKAQIVVRVLQRLARYQYSAPAITLGSLNQDSTFTVVPLDAGGTTVPANTPGLPAPVFSTTSQGVVTLQASGNSGVRLTSVGNGTTKLRIQAGTVDTSLNVTVGQLATSLVISGGRVDTIRALNDTLPLLASAFDAKNIQVRGRSITWFQQNSAIVRADPATGVVRGVALGSGRIFAQMDGALDSVTVVVLNLPTAVRTPHAVLLTTVHDSVTLVDTVFNRLGAPIAGIPATWRALDTTIAIVGATNGILEARAQGTTQVIVAIAAGAADTATVTVEDRIASIRITTPDTALASVGDTVTLRTTFRNLRGGSLGNTAATWTSTRPTIVGVQNGFLTALANGTSTIYAADPRSPSRFDSVRVSVTNAPAALGLDHHLDTLRSISTSLQYAADVRNARGALLANPTVTWHTTNQSVATVSLAGLVTARGTGTVKVFADTSFGGRTVADTATLVVLNDPKTLTVSPKSVTIPSVGARTPLQASAANAVGGPVTGLPFLWSTSDPGVATVDTAGAVTGVGVGTAVITVHLLALQDQATVTVTNAPDTIRFGVPSVTLASAGDTTQPPVTLRNALGAALPRTSALWLSDDALVARVTADGSIIAVARGTTTVRARNALNASRADSVLVTVTNAPVQLVVAPHLDTLASIGRTVGLAASAFNGRSQLLLGEPVTWISRDPSKVTVDPVTGLATAQASNGAGTWIVGSVSGAAGVKSDSSLVVVRNLAAAVSINPGALFLNSVGDSSLLTVTALNGLGKVIAGTSVSWASSNPSVVGFQPTGAGAAVAGPVAASDTMRVKAVGAGTATITAVVDNDTARISVAVANTPTAVSVTSGNLTLASVGDTVSPSVSITNGLGVTLARNAVLWASSDPAVATVSGAGLVTATGAGTTTISATSPSSASIRSSITVTVTNAPASVTVNTAATTLTAIGRTLPYTATVKNAAGGVIGGASVTWSSGTPAIVRVDAQTGIATAVAVGGPVQITAIAGAATGTAQLSVTNAAVVLTLAPDTASILNLGGTAQLTALARNDLNNPVPSGVIAWTTLDPAIATVSATGLVTATTNAANTGVARIVAAVNSGPALLADTSLVTVVDAPTAITITSGAITLASLGDHIQPATTIQDQGGATLPRTAVTWTSTAPSVATVSGTGDITAVAAGATTVRATSPYNPLVQSAVSVTVTNAPASMVLNQSSATLTAVGRTTSFSAVVRNARGDPIVGQAVTWSSGSAAVTIDAASGVASAAAVTAGATITAAVVGAPGVTATATVVVTNNAASVSAAPSSVALTSVGQAQALTTTARNDLGAAIPGWAVSYGSANTAIATVSPTGIITAAGVGSTGITVDAGSGITAAVPVTVTNDPATMAITSGNPSLNLNATFTPTVNFRNGLNAVLPITAAVWITSNTAVATVTAAGVVAAQGSGTATITATSASNPAVTAAYTVTVAAPAASIQLDRSVDSLTAVGRTLQYAATVFDAKGDPLTGLTITWSSSSSGLVSVATPGQTAIATAVAVTGATRVTITASVTSTLGTFTATAAVGVGNDPASIAVSPTSTTLTSLTQTATLTATVRNNLGNPIAGLTPAWSSSATGIATVTTPGATSTLTAAGIGNATITATLGALTATIPVTATNDLTQLSLTPATGTIASLGDTLFPAVVFKNALNAVLPRNAATWYSSSPAVATVSSDGVITGVAAGTDTVVALSPANGNLRDSIFVTVTNAAASDSLNTSLDTMTAIGQSYQVSTTVRNARHAVIPGASVTYGTTNAGIAAVASDGTITATGFGTAIVFAASGAAPADSDTVVVIGNTHPMVLWVNKDAAGPARLGTFKAPFASIQAAANAAGTGDTIYVMKAATSYAEAVSLSSGVVLAGSRTDAANAGCSSTSFCAATLLPVLAHNFGAAAITASAGTAVSVRNLAITHGVDGPTVDANGADLDAENVFVNPIGVVGTPALPMGRGFWVRSAPDSARIRRVQVRNVKGYGVRFESTNNSRVDSVTVTAVDTANGFSSRAGIHVVGGNAVRIANTTVLATGATIGTMDGIHVSGTTNARIVADSVDSGRYGLRADNSTFLDSNVAVRQAVTGYRIEGNVAHTSERARIRRTTDVGVFVGGTGNVVALRRALFDFPATTLADSLAVDVQSSAPDAQLTVDSSVFNLGAGRAVRMQAGASLSMTRDTILGDSTRTGAALDSTLAVIRTTGLSGTVLIRRTLVTDFARRYAMSIGSAGIATLDSNLVARNRAGLHLASTAGLFWTLRGNDIYDHRGTNAVGLSVAAGWAFSAALNLGNWWGDSRGPRRVGLTATNVDSVATGDSVPVGGGAFTSGNFAGNVQATPTVAGGAAAGIHLVRGSAQTLSASGSPSPAPFKLTVRVVDANGRPVSGASASASFTSGCSGDDLGAGVCTNASAVTTNASGLAELALSVGAGPHTVLVGVTAAGKTVTFTVNRQ